ncbi:MAG TPA: BofC C-terminal domain-containing protein [Candidatus Bathyarchaeia archaeon]|nr:BofC C-terminal domain-containing protein [Candidatus Bathyarchaeia archaeon]
MKRHRGFFLSWAVLLIGIITGGTYWIANMVSEGNGALPVIGETYRSAVETIGKPHELVLARSYLCGVKEEERIVLGKESFEQTLSGYKGWEIIASEEGKLILLKRENDIAPSCKENGYFGLSPDGVLTLFNGVPSEQNVIQSFYQINRAKMEATLPKEEITLLQKGIRVRDLSEYNSVLSTFSEFQTDDAMVEAH